MPASPSQSAQTGALSPRRAWLLAPRPKTLPAAIAPVLVGAALAVADGGGIGLLLNNCFGQLQYHKAGTVVAVIVPIVTQQRISRARRLESKEQ